MSPSTSDTNAPAGLSVRGLAVAYGDLHAVDGVDLDVAAGEIVALLGASGSGKSSLVNSILYQVLANRLNRARGVPGGHKTASSGGA